MSLNHFSVQIYAYFLKASDFTDAAQIPAEQLVLALGLSLLLCMYNSRQVWRVCIRFPQMLKEAIVMV